MCVYIWIQIELYRWLGCKLSRLRNLLVITRHMGRDKRGGTRKRISSYSSSSFQSYISVQLFDLLLLRIPSVIRSSLEKSSPLLPIIAQRQLCSNYPLLPHTRLVALSSRRHLRSPCPSPVSPTLPCPTFPCLANPSRPLPPGFWPSPTLALRSRPKTFIRLSSLGQRTREDTRSNGSTT